MDSNVSGFTVLYYVFSASSGIVKSRSPAEGTPPNVERIRVEEPGMKYFRLTVGLDVVFILCGVRDLR
jgi:hypothetical protein